MIKIGLIGFGYWGPNLARNFTLHPDLELAAICDLSADRLEMARKSYPQVKLIDNPDDFYKDTDLDIIAIATPVSFHFEQAKKALMSGRHVWVEKPMTNKIESAQELIELAEQKGKVLFVDHTFVFTGAIRKIKELIDDGELGELIYYDSMRVNLGLFQQDVNVIWDLAPHDLSIMDYLIPFKKYEVSANGCFYYGNGLCPKSLLTIYMENNTVAQINVSWVSPVKIRQTLIGGTMKMILYDENQPSEKIKVYDKGVELEFTKEELYHMKIQYRVGDMYAPKIEDHEALALATSHFVDCVSNGNIPLTGGKAGLEVVKVLVASSESLKKNGVPVKIAS